MGSLQLARASVPYLAALLTASLLAWFGWHRTGWPALGVVFGVLLCLTGAVVWFFRDPERAITRNDALVLSPADGTMRKLHKHGRTQTIEIFLAVTNVHVQRAPADGKVLSRKFTKGLYLVAYDETAGDRNTRCATEFRTRHGTLGLVQIAGAVARKVECWVKPGDTVRQGDRIGIIHFGSQCRVTLPASAKVLIRPGDRVAGGLTPIARWR